MRRRRVLALAATSTAAVAGCTGLQGGDPSSPSTDAPEENAQPDSTKEKANIQWSETRVNNEAFRVTATVELRGASSVTFAPGSTPENAFLKVTQSGEHVIAGNGTQRGLAGRGDIFSASWGDPLLPFSTYRVGENTTRTSPSNPNLALAGLSGGTDPDLGDGSAIDREYTTTLLNGGKTQLSLSVPENLRAYYKRRLRTPEYGAYVADTYDEPYLSTVVKSFTDYQQANDLSDSATLAHMTAFVQGLKYTKDDVTAGFDEYPRYPVETLLHRGGDCEDTAILLASLFRSFGYGAVLLSPPGHMAVGVKSSGETGGYIEHQGNRYSYIETTGEGWNIGEIPEAYRGKEVEVYDIGEAPVLVFRFGLRPRTEGDGGVQIEASIRNVGTAKADRAAFQIGFEDRNGNMTTTARSDTKQIGVQQQANVTLNAVPPTDRALRARAGVLIGGDLHDELKTDYREPER